MENYHKKILISVEAQIIADVDVKYGIIDFLVKNKILNNEDIATINNQKAREEKTEVLLNILPNRGPHAFISFHKSLEARYRWLYKEIDRKIVEVKNKNMNFDKTSLCRSPVMPLPPTLQVYREEKTKELKDALKHLSSEGYIVLHGMKGFGKSCLAVMTLRDSLLVEKLFNGKIYWIKFGYTDSIKDEIWLQLNNLYIKIKGSKCSNIHLSSQEISTKTQLKDMCRELRQHFAACSMHANSLLVLDDVSDKRMIETFDFYCKTLVITTDIDLLNGNDSNELIRDRQKIVIQMKDGFTEEESLKLFSEALSINKDSLPLEAREIHVECGGMPILIAMFAAQFQDFKDDMKKNRERWRYYLNAIRKKDKSSRVIGTFLAKQERIFDMCIDQLPEEHLKRYLSLAIFSEDVNITPKTLAILWEDDGFKIEESMVGLCNKSLAVKQWNDDLNVYVYGVHDLLLSHLKKKLSEPELIEMHKEFVHKYFKFCNDDLSKLPTDNYSYSYIGYHLEKAHMYEEFKRVYLDFGFIEGKIFNSGANDLLVDLKKYKKYIVMSKDSKQSQEIEEKIMNLENFLKDKAKTVVGYRQRNCLDLIQLALNSNTNRGFVYETAKYLASSMSTNYMYLTNDYKPLIYNDSITSDHNVPSTAPITCHDDYHEVLSTELCTVNFTDNTDKIIIGGKSGKLTRWDCSKARNHISFYGFDKKSSITKVIVSRDGQFFIALNDQSIIKQFNLSKIDELEKCREAHPLDISSEPTTPQNKQSHWSKILCNDLEDNSVKTYSLEKGLIITDIALSSDDQRIAACTNTDVIQVWNVNADKKTGDVPIEQIRDVHCQGFQLVTFSHKSNHLHVVNILGGITAFVWNGSSYVYKTKYDPLWKYRNREPKMIYLKEIPDIDANFKEIPNSEAIEIYFVYVTKTKAMRMFWNISNSGDLAKPAVKVLAEPSNSNVHFTTATLTHDGNYLLIADSEDFIKIWEIKTGFSPKKVYRERTIALDTYWAANDCHRIICGAKNYIQRMTFETNLPELPQSTTSVFDALIKPKNHKNLDDDYDEDIIAQEVNEKKIRLLSGGQSRAMIESTNGKIINLSLNSNGDKILYTTEKGEVFIYDDVNKKTTKILTLLPDCTDFVKFIEYVDSSSTKSLFIVCRARNKLLITSYGDEIFTYTLSDVGTVIALHNINNKYAITITDNENIIIWEMSHITESFNAMSTISSHQDSKWQQLWPIPTTNDINNHTNTDEITKNGDYSNLYNLMVCYSTLNSDCNMLAILKTNYELTIYHIKYNEEFAIPIQLEQYYDSLNFGASLTCCTFSPDNKYLAVGASDGKITLLNLDSNKCHIDGQVSVHCSAITQLHWAPRSIGVPILLSVNCDELAWLRTDLMINTKRRSRVGLTRSYTVPFASSETPSGVENDTILTSPGTFTRRGIRSSLTLNINLASAATTVPLNISDNSNSDNNDSNNSNYIDEKAYNYWSTKTSPYGNKLPALLRLIRLPPHCRRAKVCVSSDFSKFLLVDAHGSINKFKLFEF